MQIIETDEPGMEDQDLYAELGSSLALVHAPLGRTLEEGEMVVRIDGEVELRKSPTHGLLLHNLAAGRHWIEVSYDGISQVLEIDLVGGRVFTASFSLNRLFFFKQLTLKPQGEQIPLEDWVARFSDLKVEEVFLAETSIGVE